MLTPRDLSRGTLSRSSKVTRAPRYRCAPDGTNESSHERWRARSGICRCAGVPRYPGVADSYGWEVRWGPHIDRRRCVRCLPASPHVIPNYRSGWHQPLSRVDKSRAWLLVPAELRSSRRLLDRDGSRHTWCPGRGSHRRAGGVPQSGLLGIRNPIALESATGSHPRVIARGGISCDRAQFRQSLPTLHQLKPKDNPNPHGPIRADRPANPDSSGRDDHQSSARHPQGTEGPESTALILDRL